MSEQEIVVAQSDEEISLKKRTLQLKLENSLTDGIHLAVDTIKERLENGDFKVNGRTGDIFRVPVNSRDIAATLAILYDKRALIRGEATSIKAENKATLLSLKEGFEQFAQQLKEKDVIQTQDANVISNNN